MAIVTRTRRQVTVAALAQALVVLAAPARAAADDDGGESTARPAPSGKRTALVIAGSVLWATTYGLPIAVAAQYGFHDSGGWFFAPVAGPFVYLATRQGCGEQENPFSGAACSFGDTLLTIAVVGDGLGQIGGALMLAGGLLMDAPKDAPAARVVPVLAPTAGGAFAGVRGSF